MERSEDIFTDDIGTSEISKPVTAIDIQNREYARQLEEEKEKMKKDR